MKEHQRFCNECGDAAAQRDTAPEQHDGAALAPVSEPAPAPQWNADDMAMVAYGVEVLAVALTPDSDDDDGGLSESQRENINKRAAAVANKHFRGGGRWKEEIGLAAAIGGALFPALYQRFVSVPREERRKERERVKELERLTAMRDAQLRAVPPAATKP